MVASKPWDADATPGAALVVQGEGVAGLGIPLLSSGAVVRLSSSPRAVGLVAVAGRAVVEAAASPDALRLAAPRRWLQVVAEAEPSW